MKSYSIGVGVQPDDHSKIRFALHLDDSPAWARALTWLGEKLPDLIGHPCCTHICRHETGMARFSCDKPHRRTWGSWLYDHLPESHRYDTTDEDDNPTGPRSVTDLLDWFNWNLGANRLTDASYRHATRNVSIDISEKDARLIDPDWIDESVKDHVRSLAEDGE